MMEYLKVMVGKTSRLVFGTLAMASSTKASAEMAPMSIASMAIRGRNIRNCYDKGDDDQKRNFNNRGEGEWIKCF